MAQASLKRVEEKLSRFSDKYACINQFFDKIVQIRRSGDVRHAVVRRQFLNYSFPTSPFDEPPPDKISNRVEHDA